jgi:hypothetical protein
MSGVLHPVGPEPVRIYWLRRIVVFSVVALVLVLATAVIVNLNSAANATGPEAVPAPPASASATGSANGSATTPSWSRAPSLATTSASSTSSAAPTPSPRAASSATPSSSAKPATTAESKPSSKTAASAKPAAAPACKPSDLRPTLTGKQRVKVDTKTTFNLSMINGGPQSCALALDSDNFTLTIYSGSDRIWSTGDCAKLISPATVKIPSEGAYEWKLTWDGRRSKKTCKTRPEIPRAGTYVATAHFTGADPVRFRMLLTN